jgi:hypothetical protein
MLSTQVPSTQAHRLQTYLRTLPPDIQSRLLTEIERRHLTGQDEAGAVLIVSALRSELRQAQRTAVRVGSPSRVFFEPIEPMLVDEAPEVATPREIARSSLAPIWAWICRDLLANAARTYTESANRAILTEDREDLVQLAWHFRQRVCDSARAELATPAGRERALDRLRSFGASQRVLGDLCSMLIVLKAGRRTS